MSGGWLGRILAVRERLDTELDELARRADNGETGPRLDKRVHALRETRRRLEAGLVDQDAFERLEAALRG